MLVLTIELHRVDRLYAATRPTRVYLWVLGVGLFVTVLASIQAEIICIKAVASGTDLRGGDAVFVDVACTMLWVAVALVLTMLLAQYMGFIDWITTRQLKLAQQHPEETLRRLEYLIATHPELAQENDELLRKLRAAVAERSDQKTAEP